MNRIEPIAHITDDGRHHPLEEHLSSTAKSAAMMAKEFGCPDWGYLAGIWHDLGKYSKEFQYKLTIDKFLRVDHSTAGGIYAIEQFNGMGRILAYLIAGHHAGLSDWSTEEAGLKNISHRLKKTELLRSVLVNNPPSKILLQNIPEERPKFATDLTLSLWVRMLFSCLVDADFLDTEKFFDAEKFRRREVRNDIAGLLRKFTTWMKKKTSNVDDTPVNRARAAILDRCIQMSSSEPSTFTLTVPTGGGKTLSSMAFALHHAVKYKKRRIIYVIPYTSIVEQTANQFKQIFYDAVVEHHSNFEVLEEEGEDTKRHHLACENWDAPIIVTTSVQFFESLFASRTSRCRKLHNIANCVVILDEAQLIPTEFLNPILMALRELQKNYGVTLVLSTATQPVLGPHKSFEVDFSGIPEMIEIMDDPEFLYKSLKRVELVVKDLNMPIGWETLAAELTEHKSVLCIVNRRDDCRELFRLMPEGTIHLSALMCGAHRSEVINEIKKRLDGGKPTRVISTQLVEAGVDLDFPVVYRAVAGLDSIAQAAGRCNREGRLKKGRVVVYAPPTQAPPGHLRQAAELGRQLLMKGSGDPLARERFDLYFRQLFWLKGEGLDKHRIIGKLANDDRLRFSFRSAAQKFRIVDDSMQAPVLVLYKDGEALVGQLSKMGPERRLMRRLQRYVVNLPVYVHKRLLAEGGIKEVHPGIFVQAHSALYDPVIGLDAEKATLYEPDDLIT